MAIQFARIEIVSRSDGKNACCKGAYNARSKITDEKTNVTYSFFNRGDNVYHKILLPDHIDKKFKNISVLMNTVEHIERKKNSQLLKDIVIALPDDKEFSLQDKINITHLIIEDMQWVKNGLFVQVDIHKPHDGEKNWHAHLLVAMRRFTEDGRRLARTKARDLNPVFKTGKGKSFIIPEEDIIHERGKRIINDYAKKMGYKTRVDAIGINPQEHIGPVRMRSVMNEAVLRNEERVEANIEHLSSGRRVLERVTSNMSVFGRGDLARAVKCVPDKEIREQLVEDALADKSLLVLYDDNGKDTGYYTTKEIRSEEEKLLRLSGYIANHDNVIALGGIKSVTTANKLIDSVSASLTEEQQEQGTALSHLLLSKSALRILRGRAGTGKSYVLGHVQRIATASGINVIGLAPTHKAKGELAAVGYEQNDTVKGMLFKLMHGRFILPKYSLLVVDEAGMIGNDDYKELLRVAAGRKCNVILSGDEKQLASVQRGGMFEVFAEKYGSISMLNIQRQKDTWGRAVATALSKGNVRSGIRVLEEENKIFNHGDKDSSMQGLLADWSKSEEKLTDRLIIAVKNSDVDALNHGARQYLKQAGDLRGEEIAVGGSYYMKGDRILIKETNKDSGLINGEFGTVLHAAKDRFVISLENVQEKGNKGRGDSESDKSNDHTRIVEFNPSEYRGFRHGYASTVFKSQGASIRDVYVFHNGFAGIRNSYVALSRHVKSLRLYINDHSTKSVEHLIKQLGHDAEIGSSLSYLSNEDLEQRAIEVSTRKEKGVFVNMLTDAVDFTRNRIVAFNDKHFVDNKYYKYTTPKLTREAVEEVLDITGMEAEQDRADNMIATEERAVVGGNLRNNSNLNILNRVTETREISVMDVLNTNKATGVTSPITTNRAKQSAKERFYANTDYVRNKSNKLHQSRIQQKAVRDEEMERLRSEVKFKTEAIACDLLGEPNRKLSDGRSLRFGEHGKIAVRISGERTGSWYDFSAEKGGDMFALVQDKRGCDFKEAAEYLRGTVGMEATNHSHLKLVHDHENRDLLEKHIKAKKLEEREAKAKALQVEKLYARARDIGNRTVAYKYLTEHRGLDLNSVIRANAPSNDIKTAGIYVKDTNDISTSNKGKGKYLPALIAFARDKGGNITGGQQIILDSKTAGKADISIPKKSFGKISGSFVDVSDNKDLGAVKGEITIIAEGLETALSVKQGLHEHSEKHEIVKTLCSLGISNIRNYEPYQGERIIIAADNDGVESHTNKTIENARLALEEKGAYVEVVRPAKSGDFNDILRSDGALAISDSFEAAINKHMAQTLVEYFAKDAIETKLDEHDKSNLAYIEKYDLPQVAIVDAYHQGDISGKLKLEEVRKGLEMAASHFNSNKEIYKEARGWGYGAKEREITKSMIGMDDREALEHSRGIRDGVLRRYFEDNLNQFQSQKNDKDDLEQLKPIISAEQEFLKTTYESLKSPIEEQSKENQEYLQAGKLAATKPEILEVGGDIESHYINKTINAFEVEKNNAKEPLEVLNAIAAKHLYLSGVEEKLEYAEHLDKEIVNAIKVAKHDKQWNRLDDLNELVSFVAKETVYDNTEIVKHLKESEDLRSIIKNLTTNYQDRYLQNIEHNVERIEKRGSLIVGQKKFDCALEYLEYEAKYSHKEYVSQRELSKIQESIIAKQLEDERLAESATKAQEREAYKGRDFEM